MHCAENDEFIVSCPIVECDFDPFEVDPNVIGHFFDPYISLNLDDFDIYVGPYSFESIFDPNEKTMCFALSSFIVCVDPCPSICVHDLSHETMCHVSILACPSTSAIPLGVLNFEIIDGNDVMCSGSNVGYGTDNESPIIEPILNLGFLILMIRN
jgi:hypothetical protein